MEGYSSTAYIESLSEFGSPIHLAQSGGNVLRREIEGTSQSDAMGAYPLFTCEHWAQLGADVEQLAGTGLVSLSMVPDPFGPLTASDLAAIFNIVVPFKPHYVYDLSKPLSTSSSRHHRYYARKAAAAVSFEVCADPLAFLEEWTQLYSVLAMRHRLVGIKAFSPLSFRKQLSTPGIVAIRGTQGAEAVAGQLWFVQGDVAYSHLTAVSDKGYQNRATYGLYHYAISYFAEAYRGRVKWLDLGGGAGMGDLANDGLSEFKKGWSTGTRLAYFCGRVLDPARYDEICRGRVAHAQSYFPSYRAGELVAPPA